MSVEPASSTHPLTYTSAGNSSSTSGLSVDTNAFLKLLVAQLQYQNPLEPQSNTEFVSQLAQMTSLRQIQDINSTLESSQAYDMIGKYIYAEVLDSKTGVTNCYMGRVDSVVIKDGETYVVVGDNAIPVSNVSKVKADSGETATRTE